MRGENKMHRAQSRKVAKAFFVLFIFASWRLCASSAPSDPLSPKDEQATIKTLPGFKIELVACEPDIVDPVAMAFDDRGRMFVAEMRGYPHGGVATGQETRGRIKMLEDK